jgi:hypothetical protein
LTVPGAVVPIVFAHHSAGDGSTVTGIVVTVLLVVTVLVAIAWLVVAGRRRADIVTPDGAPDPGPPGVRGGGERRAA